MAGQKYGWQDGRDGVEPGFAEVRLARFGGPREDLEDSERASSSSTTPSGGRARDDEWLGNLLE